MRALLLLCCLLTGSVTFAQSRWSFAVDLQAGVSGKNKTDRRDVRDAENDLIQVYENGQRRGPAFSGGLTVGFRVFPFLELRSGVAYQGEQSGWYNWSDDMRPASSRANDYRYDYQLQTHRLEIPTSLRFRLLAKRDVVVRPFVEIGARPGWFMAGEYSNTQQNSSHLGKRTEVYKLETAEYSQRFSTPAFAAMGVELNRLSFSLAYHRENIFSYGQQAILCYCGVGDPTFPYSSYIPYISRPDPIHNWMAKVSFRLF